MVMAESIASRIVSDSGGSRSAGAVAPRMSVMLVPAVWSTAVA
jgi:hypothetical protein